MFASCVSYWKGSQTEKADQEIKADQENGREGKKH